MLPPPSSLPLPSPPLAEASPPTIAEAVSDEGSPELVLGCSSDALGIKPSPRGGSSPLGCSDALFERLNTTGKGKEVTLRAQSV